MGTADILGPGRGALVAELDEEDFAAKIVRLLSVDKLRERLGREGRLYAAEWGARSMAERMVRFYRATCDRRADTERGKRSVNAAEAGPG
jgi:glycosyltransferase involved in cell wall biosynthesis